MAPLAASRSVDRLKLHFTPPFRLFAASGVPLEADSGRLRLSVEKQRNDYAEINAFVPGRDGSVLPHR
jgi:hypothetical protein